MSIQAIAWVLQHSEARRGERLVLLSLANHADEHGQCYPSLARIAQEANMGERNVRISLRKLEQEGHISTKHNAAPDRRIVGNRRPNLYTLLVGGNPISPLLVSGGKNPADRGEPHFPQTIIEPSGNYVSTRTNVFLPGTGFLKEAPSEESELLSRDDLAQRVRHLRRKP